MSDLPEGWKLKTLHAAYIGSELIGLVALMKPRKYWWGYRNVAQISASRNETNQGIIDRLMNKYAERTTKRDSIWV
ncbi:hypothetical protein [Rhodococcus erythropolis]|uniref:hypothetical protein n=1 Tax=Rhodococcus erythropolis TaxID=1833 RepID=UPI00366B8A3E